LEVAIMNYVNPIPPVLEPEPLTRSTDWEEYRDAYASYEAGEWDDERWTAFRLRFGVYGQLQDGVQMVRIKIPGGLLSVAVARTIAQANREFGSGTVHVTTRQDFQMYHVPLGRTPDLLAFLYGNGVTTREACGNTLRNMTSCALAGVCPREHVDAGKVADQLSLMWLRHPYVQHMPRKFKVSVSGCGTDCGASAIHDLGLVAREKDGQQGFRVFAGGGTGGIPRSAVEVADFVVESELPAVLEALVRLHQHYSNRVNRNAARIKFLVKRFGEEKFCALFTEEFARVKAMPQRPWSPLSWRQAEDAPEPVSPGGVVAQHDGLTSIVVSPRLGLLSSDQLDGLANIAESHASQEMRTTRDQNIALLGVNPDAVAEAVAAIEALGMPIEHKVGDVPDVAACPGTTTCRIGITNSQLFGHEIVDQVRGYAPLPNVQVRVSGCQNGCGLHHVADFGFRGMGKKIKGRNAPHYQIYIGGNPRKNGHIGIAGPFVPARHAKTALKLLMDGYGETREPGESVRDWGLRLGKQGIAAFLSELEGLIDPNDEANFRDWGEKGPFFPPTVTKAECAAAYAVDTLLADLADDGLMDLDRAIFAGLRDEALRGGAEGFRHSARRLLLRADGTDWEKADHAALVAGLNQHYAADAQVPKLLDELLAAETTARKDGDLLAYRETLAAWIDAAGAIAARPLETPGVDVSRMGDFDSSVMDLIGAQGG
jgi:sulfite reductase (NADPH) hemoprotein beta-component